jgi:hypothetical protein
MPSVPFHLEKKPPLTTLLNNDVQSLGNIASILSLNPSILFVGTVPPNQSHLINFFFDLKYLVHEVLVLLLFS